MDRYPFGFQFHPMDGEGWTKKGEKEAEEEEGELRCRQEILDMLSILYRHNLHSMVLQCRPPSAGLFLVKGEKFRNSLKLNFPLPPPPSAPNLHLYG